MHWGLNLVSWFCIFLFSFFLFFLLCGLQRFFLNVLLGILTFCHNRIVLMLTVGDRLIGLLVKLRNSSSRTILFMLFLLLICKDIR